MKSLTRAERNIMEMRYGTINGIAYSQEEVARLIDMTTEKVKRLEELLFKKMNNNARNRTP